MTADRLPLETVTVIELIVAESLWTSVHFEMLPLESVFTTHAEALPPLNLVRGAGGDEPTVAGLLEGVEVPIGILNIGTVDLVPLHVASGICFDEPGSFGVDGILEVVAGERVSSVGRLLYPFHV